VKFSQDLWDGFDILNAKSEQGVQVVKDIAEFLKKRALLEAEYAKGLAALCKVAPGSGGGLFSKGPPAVEKETKSLKAALLSIQEEGSRAATGHQDFANKVLNDVVKPLETFLKAKENDRKKITTEGQKRVKAVHEAKAAVEKAKETYQRATKEAELATEAHVKANNELSASPDNKKLQEAEKRAGQKVAPLNDKAKATEAPYQKAVDTANDVITKTFGEHLPPLIDSIQQLEEERYAQLRTVLQEYLSAQRAIPTNLEDRCQDIEKSVSAIDIDADLTEFVDAHKSAATEPEKIKFVSLKDPVQTTSEADVAPTKEKEQDLVKGDAEVKSHSPAPAPSESQNPVETRSEEDLF